MEGGGGRRSCREMSPDRTKVVRLQQQNGRTNFRPTPTFRKLQVVYYLTRNGQLEHPHYVEVPHLANHHLRLKDVLDRLTILRGKGMPSLYSWSCKRSYKNGYVWNDLAENDIIYPSEGSEYVLKGSELIEGCTEKFQQGQDTLKRKALAVKRHLQPEETNHYQEEGYEEEYEEKISYDTTSTTPHSRFSRGVSNDHEPIFVTHKNPSSELTQHNSSPPSTTSSNLSDKPNNTSQRFEDGDPVQTDSLLSRTSVLFQLIACGGTMPFTGTKNVSIEKKQPPPPPPPPQPPCIVTRKSISSGDNLHKEVLRKAVAVKDEDEIICMSENPRFGNLHIEEKEYFSGSIVESMATEERIQMEPTLKKSSSYNEETSSRAALGEAAEEVKREKSVKAKCIPRKKLSSKQSNK